jgi:hypothetical protein
VLSEGAPAQPTLEDLEAKRLKKQIYRSKIREVALVSLAVIEVAYLAVRWLR